jgi:tRNA(fMet)-specific endonuclease VapC
MTAFVLDTNICIHIINGKYDLAARLKRAGLTACFLSELTVAESCAGLENHLGK